MRSTSFRTAAVDLVRPAAAALRGRLHVRRRPALACAAYGGRRGHPVLLTRLYAPLTSLAGARVE
ncbi:hypothetical protein ACFUI0_44780, partial [Streptomyces sp. NPDC057199]